VGSGFISGVGVGSGFWIGSGSGSGVGVGFVSSTGVGLGATGISDFDSWLLGADGVDEEVGEGSPGPGRREPRSTISTGFIGGVLWHWENGRPRKRRSPR